MRPAPQQAPAAGRVLFTGPDGVSDYRSRRPEDTHYVGATPPAVEGTSDALYLWRPAPSTQRAAPRRPRHAGDVGWGLGVLGGLGALCQLQRGAHRQLGPFGQAAEDQITHRYQNPWQPAPAVLDQQGRDARARLAWDAGGREETPRTRPPQGQGQGRHGHAPPAPPASQPRNNTESSKPLVDAGAPAQPQQLS